MPLVGGRNQRQKIINKFIKIKRRKIVKIIIKKREKRVINKFIKKCDVCDARQIKSKSCRTLKPA